MPVQLIHALDYVIDIVGSGYQHAWQQEGKEQCDRSQCLCSRGSAKFHNFGHSRFYVQHILRPAVKHVAYVHVHVQRVSVNAFFGHFLCQSIFHLDCVK